MRLLSPRCSQLLLLASTSLESLDLLRCERKRKGRWNNDERLCKALQYQRGSFLLRCAAWNLEISEKSGLERNKTDAMHCTIGNRSEFLPICSPRSLVATSFATRSTGSRIQNRGTSPPIFPLNVCACVFSALYLRRT